VVRFRSSVHAETPIGICACEPFPFDAEYRLALVKQLDRVPVRVVSIATLIAMKVAAGRPQDLIDVDQLKLRLAPLTGPEPGEDGIDWRLATWEGSRREQLRQWAALSLEETVRAQEEMARLAERLAASRARRASS
jgi:hypothetical protein